MVHDEHEQDRRRAARVPMSSALSESDPRATTPISDLSETGVLVHTDTRLPVGARIEIRFTVYLHEGHGGIGEDPVLFEARGRVARWSDDPRGLGVEFVELEPSARAVLRKILLRHEAQKQRPSFALADRALRTHGLVVRTRVGG